jgi:predicted RecB family nuclease
MPVTVDLMAAFMQCPYKAFLKHAGEAGMVSEYEALDRNLADEYRRQGLLRLAEAFAPDEIFANPASLGDALAGCWRLALNVPCAPERGSINFSAIERTASGRSVAKHEYSLVAFSPATKLSTDEKLAAAVLGSALSVWHGLTVAYVKMIHGPQFLTTRLVLLGPAGRTLLAKRAAAALHDLETTIASPTPPPLCLNDHCGTCEYRERCRKDAVDRDDLSLLRGLRPREIEAWKKRGIFTVTQLSYTFRAKTMGRSSRSPKRHSQPLQAVAIRDGKTYVRKRPDMPHQPTRVFFDVESVPDQELFYLIGTIVMTDGVVLTQHFWADDRSSEEVMWRGFLDLLAGLGDFTLVHFGRYERNFVLEMQRRYGDEDRAGDWLIPRLFDVHAAVRTNVFFPVYGNSLKEIGVFLGTQWQGPVRSGTDSIVWRRRWERAKDERFKEDLVRYNHEDCLALVAVFDCLATLSQAPVGTDAWGDDTDTLLERRGGAFGSARFGLPAIRAITKSAYFNYQQNRVFFRTDKNVRRSAIRKRRAGRARLRANTVVECPAPTACPACNNTKMTIYSNSCFSKAIKDVTFFRGGVRRWVVKYETRRYQCRSCRKTFLSPQYPTKQRFFGRGVACWTVYQHAALQQSFAAVRESINDVFGYSFSESGLLRAFRQMAAAYEPTENVVLSALRSGNVICADETKVGIRGGESGYVWAFSGPEVVLYRFQNSRDATLLDEVLAGFTGVLVSDFYSAYDAASCPQQKCLVHLVRDINDDLLKSPFDEQLKELASRFTGLMAPIIEAIDRYGLRKRHLARFVREADKFCGWAAGESFTSKAAQRYQNRISKYGDRLFTFLSHDGVPWNNNLAENAVKMVVSRRKMLDGLMSRDGIRDYMVFLSIYQTLRRKGGSFLRFLLSGETDVFKFLGK